MSRTQQFGREDVIAAAFSSWGKSMFQECSLKQVADHMGFSKTALYRCFRSKDDLLRGMEEHLLGEYRRAIEDFTAGCTEDSTLDELVDWYFSAIAGYFTDMPEYLYFLICRFLNSKESREMYGRALEEKEIPLIRRLLLDSVPGLEREQANTLAWFLRDSVFFWIMSIFGKGIHAVYREEGSPARSKEEIERVREAMKGITLSGVFTGDIPDSGRLEDLLLEVWLRPQEVPAPPAIFEAIEKVITANGYEGASLEKIAKEMNMDKSSMYHFFRNKEALLEETMLRENETFLNLLEIKVRNSNDPKERLWIYQVLVCSYAVLRPELLTVLHWTLYQNFNLPIPKKAVRKSIFELERLIRNTGWNFEEVRLVQPVQLLAYVYFLVSRHLHRSWDSLGIESPFSILEPLYRYIGRGFSGFVDITKIGESI
jgi:AcrR family transcriptional regulator